MKLKASASANFLFPGASIDQIIMQVSDAGIGALEFQRLGASDAEAFAPLIEASSMQVALINFDVSDFAGGGTGYSGVPGKEEEFRLTLELAYRNASILDARVAHVGPCRIPEGMRRDRCIAQLVDNVRRTLDRFAPLSTRLSIEALNRVEFPGILIGSPDEAMEVIERVGDERLVLQYDIYHAARDGRDVLLDLETFRDRTGHVQFADCPGRHEPGTGKVDFAGCFATLRSFGYDGYVGAEYLPTKDFSETVGWMALLGP